MMSYRDMLDTAIENEKELIEKFIKSWDNFEMMFDKFNDVWHIEDKVYEFIEKEKKKWKKRGKG